jgi:opacity protein-like surface antigen
MLAVPATARAQGQTQDPKVVFRPMVGGVAGSGPGASFAAAISFKTGDKMEIHGEFGQLTNILPSSVADEVEVSAALAANAVNGKHSADATSSAGYGMVGIRRSLRDMSGAHTFLELGVGMAHVTSEVNAVVRGAVSGSGDISSLVTTPFTSATPENKPMVAVGGGFILGITQKTAVEIGARYICIFTDQPAINMANIFGAFRIGF